MASVTPATPAAANNAARWGIHDAVERVELSEPEQYVFVVADSGEFRRLFLSSGTQQTLFEAGNEITAVSDDGTVFLLRDGPKFSSSRWLVGDDAGRTREFRPFDGEALAALSRDGSMVAMGRTLDRSSFPADAASTIHLVDTATLETRELAGEAQRVFAHLHWSRDQRHLAW